MTTVTPPWKATCARLVDLTAEKRGSTDTGEVTSLTIAEMLPIFSGLKDLITYDTSKACLALNASPPSLLGAQPSLALLADRIDRLNILVALLDVQWGAVYAECVREAVEAVRKEVRSFAAVLPAFEKAGGEVPDAVAIAGRIVGSVAPLATIPKSPRDAAVRRIKNTADLVADARTELADMLKESTEEGEGEEEDQDNGDDDDDDDDDDDSFMGSRSLTPELRATLEKTVPIVRLAQLFLLKLGSKTLSALQGEGVVDGVWLDEIVSHVEEASNTVDEAAGVFWEEGETPELVEHLRTLHTTLTAISTTLPHHGSLEASGILEHQAWFEKALAEMDKAITRIESP